MPSKYALLEGREVILQEVIPHALEGEQACVFVGLDGQRYFVTASEWEFGAQAYRQYAEQRQIVTSESRGSEKLALFKSLFRGRVDTYAHGYAKRQGGIGYAPVCAAERTSVCPRWNRSNPGVKCSNCSKRKLVPLDDQTLLAHMKGTRSDFRDVVGIYVLMPDCTTWVLVADFDKEGWQREASLYRDVCRQHDLCPAVERSRSGNGAHVWLFFDEPIAASLARNLGCLLITEAMEKGRGMGFDAYDRLFPTQATIDEGGFGNLIALPLQGQARQRHNSVFVDDGFIEFQDQWRYLSTVAKASAKQIQDIVESATTSPLGYLAFSESKGGTQQLSVSWSRASFDRMHGQVSGAQSGGLEPLYPQEVYVYKRNMLYVTREGLTPAAENRIRRLAAFGNPEFYRAQALHRSVYGKPRIIWCGEDDERFIMLPRGCEPKLVKLVEGEGGRCIVEDQRSDGSPIKAEFLGTLRSQQQEAVDALLQHECGVLSAPTGFGKTVIGSYLIGTLKMRTLVIVPKTELVGQWRTSIERFLVVEDDRPPLLTKSGRPSKRKRQVVGQIGAGKNAAGGIVDVATFQSLTTRDELGAPCVKPFVANYDLVICDECQHAAAPSLELVLKSVRARRVYGFSATPRRQDGLEGVLFLHCGPIRYRVSPKEQAAEQGFQRVLRPRFTRVRLPELEDQPSFNQVVGLLCSHDARNRLIADDARQAVEERRTPLVITRRREHAAILAQLLSADGVEVHLLTGEGSAPERRERMERARAASGPFAIVATGSYIGEGFDLPQLDTLLLASPYSWDGVITQYSGRLHRESEGKRDVVVYDYVDTSVPMLERMYKRRLKTFAQLGYAIEERVEEDGSGTCIVGHDEWQTTLLADVTKAQRRILVAAPYCNPKLVHQLCGHFRQAIVRGVEVRVILGEPSNEASRGLQRSAAQELTQGECVVELSGASLSGIAVFDEKTCWYGSLPLLAYAHADDCSIRFESAEVAADLLEACERSLGRPAESEGCG